MIIVEINIAIEIIKPIMIIILVWYIRLSLCCYRLISKKNKRPVQNQKKIEHLKRSFPLSQSAEIEMAIFYDMRDLMDTIMTTMDDESQYDEYEPEFIAIDGLIESLEDHHAVCMAFHEMNSSLYENKGSLECSYSELLNFQKRIEDAIMQYETDMTDEPKMCHDVCK